MANRSLYRHAPNWFPYKIPGHCIPHGDTVTLDSDSISFDNQVMSLHCPKYHSSDQLIRGTNSI